MNLLCYLIFILSIQRIVGSDLVLNFHLQNWTNPCEPNPCRAGTCEIISKINFNCHCISYVYGQLCEKLNYSQQPCDSNPCYNQGLCSPISPRDSPTNSSFICLCPPQHSGKYCQENVGECSCLNGGTCYNISYDGYRCSCPSMFTGPVCEHDFRNETFCSHSPCKNNGTCILIESSAGVCLCQPGYVGELCEKHVSFCHQNPCRNNGTCVPLSGVDGQCRCQPGYSGSLCEQVQTTFCSNNPCRNGSTRKCALIDNKYGRCLCPKDVTGPYCDIPLHSCAPNPCENNGICMHEMSSQSYKCLCTFGYSGVNCSENLNKSFCSSNPCMNNGTCLQSPTTADGICRCQEGFSGIFCNEIVKCGNEKCQYPKQVCLAESCVNVTGELYCLLHECQHGGKCNPMTRQCQCEKGFAGIKCELRTILCDQMNNVCQNNGTCLSIENHCVCTNFYTGKYCEILIEQN
ncbi:unnamed protein product [Rotaria socialis]|uniref:Uncharacterized protein n=2 Tax=Rotaria socialis TaxID=392032 RepID=A0A818Z7H6_9BILA|nr:unnamed protein product [Rotaria socialis]